MHVPARASMKVAATATFFFRGANHNDLDAICNIYIVPCHKHHTNRTAENVQCLMYLGPEGANRIIFLLSIYSHLLAFVLHLPSFSEVTLQITPPHTWLCEFSLSGTRTKIPQTRFPNFICVNPASFRAPSIYLIIKQMVLH